MGSLTVHASLLADGYHPDDGDGRRSVAKHHDRDRRRRERQDRRRRARREKYAAMELPSR